jgi:hypothetical protein
MAYRLASPQDRLSIKERGLLPIHPERGSQAQAQGKPAAVYLHLIDPRENVLYEVDEADDIWQVDDSELSLILDEDGMGTTAYCLNAVQPQRLTLIRPGVQ